MVEATMQEVVPEQVPIATSGTALAAGRGRMAVQDCLHQTWDTTTCNNHESERALVMGNVKLDVSLWPFWSKTC